MARNVTLSQLRTDISNQADIVTGASGRYTPTLLTRLINQSIQRFRERISADGARHYLVSTTGTLSTGATSPYAFLSLDLSGVSPAVVRIYGVDVTVEEEVVPLVHVPFESRNDYGGPRYKGTPQAWFAHSTAKVGILPPPDQGYTYVVWYLPVFTDLSADGDNFDGVAGWEDYIVWDVVCRLITRDNYASQYQLAKDQCREIWTDIVRNATRITDAGGGRVGRDTFGQKLSNQRDRRRYLPRPS